MCIRDRVNGVTGKAGSYREDLDHHLAQLHEIASIPVLTGFGVSSMEDVHRFNKVSDGVIAVSYTHLPFLKIRLAHQIFTFSYMRAM